MSLIPIEVFNFATWLSPIPFMLLYSLRTAKLDFLSNPKTAPILIVPSLFLGYFADFNFFLLMLYYSIMVAAGVVLLEFKRVPFAQALSLSFITAFLNSVYWEIPILVYTAIYRGYIDAAFPLHVLNFVPVTFLIYHLRIDKKRLILPLGLGLLASTLLLLPLITTGTQQAILSDFSYRSDFAEIIWAINRFLCFIPLIYIVHRSKITWGQSSS